MNVCACVRRKVRTLGDEDDDDDGALEWVKRSRKMEEEKIQAERRVCISYVCLRLCAWCFLEEPGV